MVKLQTVQNAKQELKKKKKLAVIIWHVNVVSINGVGYVEQSLVKNILINGMYLDVLDFKRAQRVEANYFLNQLDSSF